MGQDGSGWVLTYRLPLLRPEDGDATPILTLEPVQLAFVGQE